MKGVDDDDDASWTENRYCTIGIVDSKRGRPCGLAIISEPAEAQRLGLTRLVDSGPLPLIRTINVPSGFEPRKLFCEAKKLNWPQLNPLRPFIPASQSASKFR